jgi:hypothetical protein
VLPSVLDLGFQYHLLHFPIVSGHFLPKFLFHLYLKPVQPHLFFFILFLPSELLLFLRRYLNFHSFNLTISTQSNGFLLQYLPLVICFLSSSFSLFLFSSVVFHLRPYIFFAIFLSIILSTFIASDKQIWWKRIRNFRCRSGKSRNFFTPWVQKGHKFLDVTLCNSDCGYYVPFTIAYCLSTR